MVMEGHLLSFPILLTLIIIIISLFILKAVGKTFKNTSTASKLPPGPWKLPFIGSLHHLAGGLGHHRMRDLSQKYGPIMHLQLGENSTILVSSPEIAKEVMKTHGTNFAQRPPVIGIDVTTSGYTDIIFSPYGDYWRQLRKICTLELLSAKRVRSFQSIREEEVSDLLRYVSMNTGSSINLSDKLLSMTYAITARATFGEKCKDQDAYVSLMKETTRLVERLGVANMFPSRKWIQMINTRVKRKLKELHGASDLVLENMIRATTTTTKIGGDGSLLSVLMNLKEHDGDPEFHLTINNIKAVLQDMFTGGSETSTSTLEWAFSEMLKSPRVLKKAQAEVREVFCSKGCIDEMGVRELKYLKAVIKETLRLHPAGPLILRECREACEINGYTIPVGTHVFVNVWATGRDPKHWSEAEKFYPERFLDCPVDYNGSYFEFIPFGAGKRICPGISFALPNIELPLAQLLYYFDWELPSGVSHENLDMTEAFAGITSKKKNELLVIPISYNSVPFE